MGIHKLTEERRAFYKSIVSVQCPILGETVYFTSEGFNHLLYKSHFRPRSIPERFMKLSCLKYAPIVLRNCNKVSEVRNRQEKRKGKVLNVLLYELVHEVAPRKKIRVVVKKVGLGKHKFLSVMPHDRRSKHKKHR